MAAVLALGMVSVPRDHGSIPWLTEISAVRLQAEVTSIVGGLDEPTVGQFVPTPPPAATGASYVADYSPIDKLVWNLPPQIRNIVLPPLVAVAWAFGAVLRVAYFIVSPILKLLNIDPFTPAAAGSLNAAPMAKSGSVSSVPGDKAMAASVVAPDDFSGRTELGYAPTSAGTSRAARTGGGPATDDGAVNAAAPVAEAGLVPEGPDRVIVSPDITPVAGTTPPNAAANAPATRPIRGQHRPSDPEPTDPAPASSRAAKRSVR